MNHLVARPSQVAHVKRARRVMHTHPAEALDVEKQVAITAECQASMEYRHGPVHMMIFFEAFTTDIFCLSESDLAAAEKPWVQAGLQKMVAIFAAAFRAKATHCTLALRLHRKKPRQVCVEKRCPKVNNPSNNAWMLGTYTDQWNASFRSHVASDPRLRAIDDAPKDRVISFGFFQPVSKVDQQFVGIRTFQENIVPQDIQ
jgi:hypothetical protein